jgi:hypothetical protein
LRESGRERVEDLTGSAIEVLGAESRERSRLADQESPERDDLGAHDAEREPASQVVEGSSKVRRSDADGEFLVQSARERLRVGEDVRDDLAEERVLVAVVVVHGALREAGRCRDLLHGRPRVAMAEEQRPRRVDDGGTRPDDARVIRARRGGARSLASGAWESGCCTHG